MSTTTANQARAAALKATGASITFAAVAKAAGVSTWIVYAEGIREHIDAARRRQAHHSTAPAPTPSGKHTMTSASQAGRSGMRRAGRARRNCSPDSIRPPAKDALDKITRIMSEQGCDGVVAHAAGLGWRCV